MILPNLPPRAIAVRCTGHDSASPVEHDPVPREAQAAAHGSDSIIVEHMLATTVPKKPGEVGTALRLAPQQTCTINDAADYQRRGSGGRSPEDKPRDRLRTGEQRRSGPVCRATCEKVDVAPGNKWPGNC
jgi:hypothetical protein